MKKLMTLAFMALAASGLQAMDERQALLEKTNYVFGQPVTPKTIAALSEQYEPLSEQVEQDLKILATKHQPLFHSLARPTKQLPRNPQQLIQELRENTALLKQAGFTFQTKTLKSGEVVAGWNYSFPVVLGGIKHWVKRTSPVHTKESNNSFYNQAYGSWLNDTQEPVVTYQTPSSAVAYLRYLQAIVNHDPSHFIIPQTKLAQIEGKRSIKKHASDENTFVIQKDLKGFVPLQENLALLAALSPAAANTGYHIFKDVPLFDYNENNGLISTDGKALGTQDIEHPNSLSPSLRFYGLAKNLDDKVHGTVEGLKFRYYHDGAISVGFFLKCLKQAQKEGLNVDALCRLYKQNILQDADYAALKEHGFVQNLYKSANEIQ